MTSFLIPFNKTHSCPICGMDIPDHALPTHVAFHPTCRVCKIKFISEFSLAIHKATACLNDNPLRRSKTPPAPKKTKLKTKNAAKARVVEKDAVDETVSTNESFPEVDVVASVDSLSPLMDVKVEASEEGPEDAPRDDELERSDLVPHEDHSYDTRPDPPQAMEVHSHAGSDLFVVGEDKDVRRRIRSERIHLERIRRQELTEAAERLRKLVFGSQHRPLPRVQILKGAQRYISDSLVRESELILKKREENTKREALLYRLNDLRKQLRLKEWTLENVRSLTACKSVHAGTSMPSTNVTPADMGTSETVHSPISDQAELLRSLLFVDSQTSLPAIMRCAREHIEDSSVQEGDLILAKQRETAKRDELMNSFNELRKKMGMVEWTLDDLRHTISHSEVTSSKSEPSRTVPDVANADNSTSSSCAALINDSRVSDMSSGNDGVDNDTSNVEVKRDGDEANDDDDFLVANDNEEDDFIVNIDDTDDAYLEGLNDAEMSDDNFSVDAESTL